MLNSVVPWNPLQNIMIAICHVSKGKDKVLFCQPQDTKPLALEWEASEHHPRTLHQASVNILGGFPFFFFFFLKKRFNLVIFKDTKLPATYQEDINLNYSIF